MARWSTRHAATRWCFLLLLASSVCGQLNEDQSLAVQNQQLTAESTVLSSSSKIQGNITATTRQNVSSQGNMMTTLQIHKNDTDEILRGERMMLVYVKPNSTSESRNVSDLPEVRRFEDVLVKAAETETVVITDFKGNYEDEREIDDDLLMMEARSLEHSDKSQSNIKNGSASSKLQDLGKNASPSYANHSFSGGLFDDFDFNGTDVPKINVASLLAKEYEEMYKLMNEDLDTDQVPPLNDSKSSDDRSGISYDGMEPRDTDGIELNQMRKGVSPNFSPSWSDLESSASANRPVYIAAPLSLTAGAVPSASASSSVAVARYPQRKEDVNMPESRPRARIRTIPTVRRPNQQSDSSMAIVFSPRPTQTASPQMSATSAKPDPSVRFPLVRQDGPAMIFIPTESMMRLQRMPTPSASLAAQRTQMSSTQFPSNTRRPQSTQNDDATSPHLPFGMRIKKPSPFSLNMSFPAQQPMRGGNRAPQTYFRSSPVSHILPAPSQISAVKRRAPNRFYLRQPTQNNLLQGSPQKINQLGTQNTSSISTSNKAEFGARLRPMIRAGSLQSSVANSTARTKATKTAKEQRQIKINQLRSTLVGKLVVMQSMLDEKQSKSGKMNKARNATSTEQFYTNDGVLKRIKPLRPPKRPDSATSTTALTTSGVVVVTTVAPITTPNRDATFIADPTEPMFVLKDKKKYRRPPSSRKNHVAENQNQDDAFIASASGRESVVSEPEDTQISETSAVPESQTNTSVVSENALIFEPSAVPESRTNTSDVPENRRISDKSAVPESQANTSVVSENAFIFETSAVPESQANAGGVSENTRITDTSTVLESPADSTDPGPTETSRVFNNSTSVSSSDNVPTQLFDIHFNSAGENLSISSSSTNRTLERNSNDTNNETRTATPHAAGSKLSIITSLDDLLELSKSVNASTVASASQHHEDIDLNVETSTQSSSVKAAGGSP